MKRHVKWLAVLGIVAMAAAACSSNNEGPGTSATPGGTPQKGGILKVEAASDVLAVMDPQKEYYQDSWQLLPVLPAAHAAQLQRAGLEARRHDRRPGPGGG